VEEPFAFDQDDEGATATSAGAFKRSEQRDSMFLGATISLPDTGESWPMRVRNISAGGLMAECAQPFDRGAKVELELRGIGLQRATIAWIANGRLGATCARPINPILTRKPVGQGRTTVG